MRYLQATAYIYDTGKVEMIKAECMVRNRESNASNDDTESQGKHTDKDSLMIATAPGLQLKK